MSRPHPHLVALLLLLLSPTLHAAPATKPALFFEKNDRIAFIGSSSTKIGVWPQTIEFLLRTRHPDLALTFSRHTTGGGTFATGLVNLDKWLAESKPTVVLFNYGGNDATAAEKGLDQFKSNIDAAIAKVHAAGARAILMTHQPSDLKYPKVKEIEANRRTLYADTMLAHARAKGYPIIDTHHPLDRMQLAAQKDDPSFTIMVDQIHLNSPAYIAWAFFLYDGLQPLPSESSATLTADGQVTATTRCKISDVKADATSLSFTRGDEILPILPPAALPPRKYVPLEQHSRYLLKVTGLPEGQYDITCDAKPLGVTTARALAEGVNLNTLLLDSGNPAPWDALAKDIWSGRSLDQIGRTTFRFAIARR